MQEFHKKLTKSNIKSQENSTYIFINFNMQQLSQKYHKTLKKYVWKFLEFLENFRHKHI
jgi:tyrosine-protein phosphatase YwqE